MNDVVLHMGDLHKTYKQAGNSLHVLKGVNAQIRQGEMVALVGPSGSGKSTLLQMVGLLDAPSSGVISINGREAQKMDERNRTRMRRDAIGFVYQFHHLLPEFSALENVIIPQMIAGAKRDDAADRALKLLARLGLEARADHRPARLSGGEQQRVAIARALANRPKLLLADEPTGNLDPETAESVFSLLQAIVRKTGVAAMIATHNLDLAKRMDRTLSLKDGVLV